MQTGKRYTLLQTLNWTKKYIFIFFIIDLIAVILFHIFNLKWVVIPWQPISLIGVAVAFYLGFKNNSSYERLWEARKIWGGIVNSSRSFTVMVRDFVNNDESKNKLSENELKVITRKIIDRHIAWLHCLTLELRKLKDWEHNSKKEMEFRKNLDVEYDISKYEKFKNYLDENEYKYIMSKGNKSSQLLSLQAKEIMKLRELGLIEHFRHLEIQGKISEFFELQGMSERIKNFPFPRQYATVNFFFASLFILLLPFGMIDVFKDFPHQFGIWLTVPFSIIVSWVFWMMEMIGEFSENPFEGLYNDVPIKTISRSIEIDILEMLDETNLPEQEKIIGNYKLSM